jgi:tRNA pseudouridine38-40 synthase
MHGVDSYTGNDLGYLNPKGTIPTTAVIKKNERRTNPFREKRRFDSTNFPANGSSSAAGLQTQPDQEDEDEEEDQELDKTTLADTEG